VNDRIKELAYQTKLKTGALPGSEEWQTVFAELIVKECADFVDNAISDGGIDGRSLKEHFGVE